MKALHLLLLLLLPLLLCQCTDLRSESGLYNVPLEKHLKLDVDGSWFANKPELFNRVQNGSLYLAPLNIQAVSQKEPELAPVLQQQMDTYLREAVTDALTQTHSRWTVTDNPAAATLRIDMAVVRLKPQRPALNIAGKIGSIFSPVPFVGNATEALAGGDIVVEGTVRDVKTGQLLMAFKDSNRKKGRIINGTAFTRSGQAEASLKSWAHSVGQLILAAHTAAATGKSVEQLIEEESIGHALLRRAQN